MKKIIALLICFFTNIVSAETCLSVEGLSFEKISSDKLLVIANGKNIATLQVYGSLPKDGRLEFRFFTPTICDRNQNNEFMVNGQLQKITYASISKFK